MENILFYIPKTFIYEIVLVPFIYCRTLFYTIKNLDSLKGVPLLVGWIFLGLFFLFYGVCTDMINFIKVLLIIKGRKN